MQDREHRVADLAARRGKGLLREQAADLARAQRMADVDIFSAQLHFRIQGRNNGAPIEVAAVSEVAEHLWIGGAVPGAKLPERFVAMVSCHPWTPYTVVHAIRAYMALPMTDSDLDLEPDTWKLVVAAAALVNICRAQGPTLVHCTAGLNRSALVAGLAMLAGRSDPDAVITALRERRSPHVLNNLAFEMALRQAPAGLAGFIAV